MTRKMTLNLGVRYDYFGPINETNGGQANFVPSICPLRALETRPSSFRPVGKTNEPCPPIPPVLEPDASGWWIFLKTDGIALDVTNKYGQGLLHNQNANFSPRLGMAYQITSKLVGRGSLAAGLRSDGQSSPSILPLSPMIRSEPLLP